MRIPTIQFVCLAGVAFGALASFQAAGQEHGEEAQAMGDAQAEHPEVVVVDEGPHARPPVGVPLAITSGDWLRAPGEEWLARQAEAEPDRFFRGDFEETGEEVWFDTEGVYYYRYDAEEDIGAYWQWVPASQLTRGRQNYLQYCSSCHGVEGNGYGRSGQWLRPSPRDFTSGYFKFTKQLAPLPTDAALHGLVKRGLNGTPMLPWALGDDQLDDIIQYLKYLSPEGQAWRDWFTDIGDPVDAGEDPWKNDEVFAIERGKKLYHGQANCASCHPGYVRVEDLPELLNQKDPSSRPDYYLPVLKESMYTVLGEPVKILPPDFTFHSVRSGHTTEDLFKTIASGIKGTAMPQWKGALSDKDIWAIAYYVESLVDEYKDDPAARAEFFATLKPQK